MNEQFQNAIDVLNTKINSERTGLCEYFSDIKSKVDEIKESISDSASGLEGICDDDYDFLTTYDPKLSREKFMFADNGDSQKAYELQKTSLDYAFVSKLKTAETKSKYKSILEYDYADARNMALCDLRLLVKANNREMCEKLAEIKIGFSAEKWEDIVINGKMVSGISYANATKCLDILTKYNVKAELLCSCAYKTCTETAKETKQPYLDVIAKTLNAGKQDIQVKVQSKKSPIRQNIISLCFGVLVLFAGILFLIMSPQVGISINQTSLITTAVIGGLGVLLVLISIIKLAKNKKFCRACKQEEESLESDYKQCVAKIEDAFNRLKYGIPKELADTYAKDLQEGYDKITSVRAEYLPKVKSKIERNEKYLARAISFLPENIAGNDRLLRKIVELMKGGFATDYKTALWQAKQEIEKEDEKIAALRREEKREREERDHRQAVLESQRRAEKMAEEQARYAREQAEYAKEQAASAAAMAESQKRTEDYAKQQSEAAEKTARETEAIHNNQKFGTNIY